MIKRRKFLGVLIAPTLLSGAAGGLKAALPEPWYTLCFKSSQGTQTIWVMRGEVVNLYEVMLMSPKGGR